MISYEKKCIFVHIPKTGGTSIENAIWGRDGSKRTTRHLWMGAVRPGFNKYQSGGLQHLLAPQIRQEVGADVFNRFYKFAFVRNPWDKVVSQFFYVKTRPDLLRFFGMNVETSLKGYLDRVRVTEHVQSMEQWRFVADSNGEQLVDFVGRFENLAHDFGTVANQVGLTAADLPHDMKSQGRDRYQSYYGQQTVDEVASIYQKDIELFGYSFDKNTTSLRRRSQTALASIGGGARLEIRTNGAYREGSR